MGESHEHHETLVESHEHQHLIDMFEDVVEEQYRQVEALKESLHLEDMVGHHQEAALSPVDREEKVHEEPHVPTELKEQIEQLGMDLDDQPVAHQDGLHLDMEHGQHSHHGEIREPEDQTHDTDHGHQGGKSWGKN